MANAILNSYSVNATDVRRDWSNVIDTAVHKRPVFIKRTHDNVMMINSLSFEVLLDIYKFHITIMTEDDGTVTGSIKEIDIADNASTKEDLVQKLIIDLREYASDYYNEFDYWYSASNRKQHAPYVMKILVSTDSQLKEAMICHAGKN